MAIIRNRRRSNLWDLDVFSSAELAVWLSLHPQATRQSAITIATGVSAATDVSGNTRNFAQGDPTKQPVYQATGFNGFPAINFDGTDDNLISTNVLTGNPNFTVLAIYKKDVATKGHLYGWGNLAVVLGGYALFDNNALTAFSFAGSFTQINSISTDTLIICDTKPSGPINLSTQHKNGVLQSPISSSSNTPNIQAGNLALGRSGNLDFFFDGQIAEFAIWNKVLSADERQRAEGIFAHRWWRLAGQPVPLSSGHPYFSTPPTR